MRTKALISGLLVILHISITVWYYCHPIDWVVNNSSTASLWFFGIPMVLYGFNVALSSTSDKLPIHVEIIKFQGIFLMLLGTIYAFHYSGLLTTTNREKLIMICVGALLTIIIILVSAWRHGFFNIKTYDR